uniref:VWFA domain-containing protein n=1 Tax=Esox lucius TaxID=8010 RepID=A0A6Q2Z603_ESOLU
MDPLKTFPANRGVSLRIQEWVEEMQKDLITLTDMASGVQDLIQIFQNYRNYYRVEYNDANGLVANAAKNIEKLLEKRSEALKKLASAAEEFQMQHHWKNDLEVNKRKANRLYPEFKEDEQFRRLISYNTTAVHIPTDIYEGSTIMLNELNWTDALEDVFRKNKEEDPSLLWQVFGSATGLARYFPASPWMDSQKVPKKLDLYDVRRRPWYIQGAASPKDMLILVDASGSVSGLTHNLIRNSVNEMLETLSDDDYVNVVFFNKTAGNVACFENLVQANVRNKKYLKEAVDHNIFAQSTTNYKEGFELAFKQLSTVNVTEGRAFCNKIIMLFTDGGEERAQEIFQKYNSKKEVRIFTFSVGQHNYDKEPIQWMACTNKGYYYEIPSIGAIRINTQEYLDVLGRPMVKADKKAKVVQWTNVYLDALVCDACLSETSRPQNQQILGVMAIDVSLDDIKRLTPRFTFGPNGYYFAIDPNGYVLLHPNLCPKNPNIQEPVTLDFLDAELENDVKVEIRTNMINGETSNRTVHTLVKSQDECFCIYVCVYVCAYLSVSSLALVLPHYSLHYIHATIGDTITQAKFSESLQADMFKEYGYTLIAPREYCKDLKPSKNNTEFLMDFNKYIDRKTPNDPLCEKLRSTLVHTLLLESFLFRNGVLAGFVATDGGITRIYPESAGLDWTEDPETYESGFYKRSLDNDLYIFTPTSYQEDNNSRLRDDCIQVSHSGPTLIPIISFSPKQFNSQHFCDPKSKNKESAAGLRSVYVPTIADILNVGWLASAAKNICVVEIPDKESCITEQTQYFFDNDNKSFSGTLECENCSRLFHAEKLGKTNLVFIIVDNKLSCLSCDDEPLTQAEQESSGPDPCELAKKPRYRKGPKLCFDNNTGVSQHCFISYLLFPSSTCSLAFCLSLLLFSLTFSFCFIIPIYLSYHF